MQKTDDNLIYNIEELKYISDLDDEEDVEGFGGDSFGAYSDSDN